MFRDLVDINEKVFQSMPQFIDRLLMTSYYEKYIQVNEEKTLFEFLKTCKCAALVLPEYDCNIFARNLSLSGHQSVFVGKERYGNSETVVFMSGLIPTYVIKRLRSIVASGILDWHSKFELAKKTFQPSESKLVPKKPTMSGNVVVIFLLLPAGFLLSFILLICETLPVAFRSKMATNFWMKTKIRTLHQGSTVVVKVLPSD